MRILYETGNALGSLVAGLIDGFIRVIPGLIAAIVLLIVGYFVGKFLGFLVKKKFLKTNLAGFITKNIKSFKNFDVASFFGIITKWYIFILFLSASAHLIKLVTLQTFLLSVSLWVPNLIIAIIIVFVGIAAGDYVHDFIKDTKMKSSKIVASITRIIIILVIAIIALNQGGINIRIAENSFLIILTGIVLMIAIAFGFALKDEAKSTIKHIKKITKIK